MNRSYYWDEDTFDNAEIADDENIDEVIETANELIDAFAAAAGQDDDGEALTDDFSEHLWDYYCFQEHLPVMKSWLAVGTINTPNKTLRVSYGSSHNSDSDYMHLGIKILTIQAVNGGHVLRVIADSSNECDSEFTVQFSDGGFFEAFRHCNIEEE